jgi:predicted ATPase
MGYPDQGLKRSQEAVTLARQLSHPYSLATTLAWAGVVHLRHRAGHLAQALYDEVMALATELGFTYWQVAASQFKSRALLQQGRVEEALALVRESLPAWQAIGGVQVGLQMFLAGQAEIYSKAGLMQEACPLLVYNWFTEGFDTADLKDAKALLDQLS